MIGQILVATDGSDCGGKAVKMAADLAGKYGAQLHILHVLMHGEPPVELHKMAAAEHLVSEVPPQRPATDAANMGSSGIAPTDLADIGRYRLDHKVISALGELVIRNAAADAKEQGAADIVTRIREGDVADEILSACRDGNMDMVVLGSRGRGQLSGLLLGSTSQKVAQLSKCSCLIVH